MTENYDLKTIANTVYSVGCTVGGVACRTVQDVDWGYVKEKTDDVANLTATVATEAVRKAYAAVYPPPKASRARFAEGVDVETRKQLCRDLQNKHPDYIPIIVERASSSRLSETPKRKYLAPSSITIGNFTYRVRSQIEDLKPHEGLFFFTSSGAVASPLSIRLYELYWREKSKEDGFLYLFYREESVFGG